MWSVPISRTESSILFVSLITKLIKWIGIYIESTQPCRGSVSQIHQITPLAIIYINHKVLWYILPRVGECRIWSICFQLRLIFIFIFSHNINSTRSPSNNDETEMRRTQPYDRSWNRNLFACSVIWNFTPKVMKWFVSSWKMKANQRYSLHTSGLVFLVN